MQISKVKVQNEEKEESPIDCKLIRRTSARADLRRTFCFQL